MGYEMKLMRNVSRVKSQKLFGLSFFAVCFLFTVAFLSLSRPVVIPLPILGFRLTNRFPTYVADEEANASQLAGSQKKVDARMEKNSTLGLTSSTQHQDGLQSNLPYARNQKTMQEMKPLCDFSDPRSDTCEMEGDIRIHGNSSSVSFIISSQETTSQGEESWSIKPHCRKGDPIAMGHISTVAVKSLLYNREAPQCTVNHSVPAIVFSTGGYMGNIFHDFTDVLIPLFITSRQYNGEVQFLISETHSWWLAKFAPYLKALSHYKVIDFNKEERVHCYSHVIVGLRSHKEMSIDPRRAPNGYSMVDFARLMRTSFSLERESAIKLGADESKKPRLLIIARKRTRSFTNVDEIVKSAEGLGYEVVVAEANVSSNLVQFSRIVNSCDVMMGVHGAGLTNLVFLPTNATVIQVVPLGELEKICWADFGGPSMDMGLRYLQYSISEEESTLLEMYPRDHPVFKDPTSIKKQGWMTLRGIYLDKQSVRLDVERFKSYLVKALDSLRE